MDLFDLGTYFSSHVPVKALNHPLLKFAACACSAKQLGRTKEARGTASGRQPLQAQLNSIFSEGNTDWYYCGAEFYDRAIQLLMKVLQGDSHTSDLMSDVESDLDDPRAFSPSIQARRSTSNARSDEVLAATAILCVYEFLDASGPAWNRHLSGTKTLLDIAQRQMTSADGNSWPPVPKYTFSAARKAIFWNFARQDYLSGRECM
jgi:Fungal specific transcription factor domain